MPASLLASTSSGSLEESHLTIYTVIVTAVVAVVSVLLTQRLTRQRELLRDNQTRLATLVTEALGTAYEFQLTFEDFCFHAPRGGGAFGPADSDRESWEQISEEDAHAHDLLAAEAGEKMMELQRQLRYQLGVLSAYAPQEVIDNLESLHNAFTEMIMNSHSERFEGARAQETAEKMNRYFVEAAKKIRNILQVKW